MTKIRNELEHLEALFDGAVKLPPEGREAYLDEHCADPDLRGQIETRDVLVVEDIVDTGHTLNHVSRFLLNRKPRKMMTVALLDKPSRREVDFTADLVGFEIPDEFVVGYGIDFAQRNRNLPFIGKVRFVEDTAP